MTNMRFSVIVAATPTMGIGQAGQLPWRLSGDLKYFKKVTSSVDTDTQKNAVIMGRKTWESIPAKFRPLPKRINVVLTRDPSKHENLKESEDVLICTSLDNAFERLEKRSSEVNKVFVIGGGQIYKEAMKMPNIDELHLTTVTKGEEKIECDTFLDFDKARFKEDWKSEPQQENGFDYHFAILKPLDDDAYMAAKEAAIDRTCPQVPHADREDPNHEEWQYLDMIRECIEKGAYRGDRTGTGTLSTFGRTMRYSLRDGVFPLLTTKRVFWRGVAEELLWFVKGSTNANELAEKKIHIWDGNGSREFLDKRGFPEREVGDLGPVYGFQWRHFGAEYKDMHTDYKGQGVDQLMQCIDLIKNNPNSRRIIMSAWNPAAQRLMALPPCHMFAQFYVAKGELSCQMYQRSADTGLGVPFNIASYALLTRMMAQVCGLKAGEFIHVIGDCHVYANHVEPLKEQLVRQPGQFPKLEINPEIKEIDGFEYKDFTIVGYKPQKKIKMKMAV